MVESKWVLSPHNFSLTLCCLTLTRYLRVYPLSIHRRRDGGRAWGELVIYFTMCGECSKTMNTSCVIRNWGSFARSLWRASDRPTPFSRLEGNPTKSVRQALFACGIQNNKATSGSTTYVAARLLRPLSTLCLRACIISAGPTGHQWIGEATPYGPCLWTNWPVTLQRETAAKLNGEGLHLHALLSEANRCRPTDRLNELVGGTYATFAPGCCTHIG